MPETAMAERSTGFPQPVCSEMEKTMARERGRHGRRGRDGYSSALHPLFRSSFFSRLAGARVLGGEWSRGKFPMVGERGFERAQSRRWHGVSRGGFVFRGFHQPFLPHPVIRAVASLLLMSWRVHAAGGSFFVLAQPRCNDISLSRNRIVFDFGCSVSSQMSRMMDPHVLWRPPFCSWRNDSPWLYPGV